ncbi:MAG: hypothetical protein CMH83_12810 [Nocardioides sp.]|nr:hypothetical protein [Nocardioides sp.]
MTPTPAPRLRVVVDGRPSEHDADRVVLGRDLACDVVVADPRVSRRHVVLQRRADGWWLSDESSSGTWVDGARTGTRPLPGPVVVALGDVAGIRVELAPLPARAPAPAPAAAPVGAAPRVVPPGQLGPGHTLVPQGAVPGATVTIGRELGNDVVLDDPLVSRRHALLHLATPTAPARLVDLRSFNGTFVDGRRVQGEVSLHPGTEVVLGHQAFRWDGQQLVRAVTRQDLTLRAEGLSVVVDDGRKRLLENVSLALEPGSLTAVIGPSGAGKSTLLGALTGLRPATHGRVVWQGHDLYRHYDQLRHQVGLVPQQDILHPQLQVRQALGYAAELRLSPDTDAGERRRRVDAVASRLGLSERMDNRIGTQLSGGQRKRVSIATELLTAPPLLFLDEPTSGLDPGLDLEVMRQLRTLADDGRVVVVVTHSVLALDVCDDVCVLAPGGRVAYLGPPAGVLAHFGVASYPEVFDLLDEPDLWQRIPRPAVPDTGSLPATAAPVPPVPPRSVGRQLGTLVRRNAAVVLADRLLLTMLLALPLVLGGLSRLVPGSHGLSLDAGRSCPQRPGADVTALGGGTCEVVDRATGAVSRVDALFDVGEPLQRITVLVVAACLMGVALTIRELVGERPVFRREYAVGLSPGVYLASKVLVLGSAAFVQGLVVTLIATVGLPGADGRLGTLRVAVVIGLLTLVMAVTGLALSAVVTSTEQTMPALVGVIMVQLVLSGALFQVHARPLLEQVAWLAPARWAYAASAGAMGLDRIPDPRFSGDTVASAGAGAALGSLVAIGLLGVLTLAAAYVLVRRSATRPE